SGRSEAFDTEERLARREVLESAFANQLRATAATFQRLAPEIAQEAFEQALEDLIEQFRAYRTYPGTPSPQFDTAYEYARAERPSAALDAIADVVHSEVDDARDPARRFNQLAASVAAKAVEDTA